MTKSQNSTPTWPWVQAQGITPDIKILQDVPDNLKDRTDSKGEAALRGHLKGDGQEETGSQAYVPPNQKDDKALNLAYDLLRGKATNPAFPPSAKSARSD